MKSKLGKPEHETKRVWRRIDGYELVGASRYTGYVPRTMKLTLECGHVIYRKASVPLGSTGKAHCRDCARAKGDTQ